MDLLLRSWFDPDFVGPAVIPSSQFINAAMFTNQQSFKVAAVGEPPPIQNIIGTKFVNQQSFATSVVAIPPAPPYRVKVRNVTTSGSVGSVAIVDDPANLPQQFLDVNFPVSGAGSNLGVNALSFPGADLGAKINAAYDAGNFDIFVPNSAGLVISTPIRMHHSMTLRFSERYPQFIDCKTNNKPVFEASELNCRNFNIDGGFFQGNAVQTPSCLLLLSSNSSGTQQGSNKPLSNIESQGHWGVGVVIHIAAEVCIYENCKLNQGGKGDSPWAGHQSTVTMGNADYWGVPWAYTQPNTHQQSTSAIIFENCQFGADMANSNQTMMLMKGQVEDVQVNGTYMNAVGKCHFLFEPGFTALNGWTSSRRIKICGGGRTETNKGVTWAGIPVVIVDGLNQGQGVFMLTMADFGVFIGGGMSHTTPMIRVINGGTINGLAMPQGIYIEPMTNKLIDNLVSDMNDVAISMPLNMDITCTGKTFNNCYIRTRGNIFGNVAASSRIRAANFNNW